MVKRMLIDTSHAEETRVIVLDGTRLEDFDVESAAKKQLRGNIYLAKVTRVEPSLQAAFVEYGGNRHGFLSFSEIHPDYYRIPIADREALKNATQRQMADFEFDDIGDNVASSRLANTQEWTDQSDEIQSADEPLEVEEQPSFTEYGARGSGQDNPESPSVDDGDDLNASLGAALAATTDFAASSENLANAENGFSSDNVGDIASEDITSESEKGSEDHSGGMSAAIEYLGGEDAEEPSEKRRQRSYRNYKIQEVIARRQIMLVQVVKEERGSKGAALTTFLSLAGRYCVLMPNTPRGGGVSRKITSVADRRRLKTMVNDFEIPDGMAVIVRTAGMERAKPEIRRDYEYLLRLWNDIREQTLVSTAPSMIYEEGDLIKRSIRDLYTRDIDEILVDGEEGYKIAKSFMKMIVPSHAKRVQLYRDPAVPMMHRYQAEAQLDAIHNPTVQLKSGGYIVINPTEALVAIDVNSGKATRERHIEETALKTNLEAADEIARQVRLRDLAGLIVIDFIDMEDHRNNAAVERRIKEAMKNDRARIQLGRISPFGLLEMSRQRLRPSLLEASTQRCPHCAGSGMIRSTESTSLHVLRLIEEEGMRGKSAEIAIYVPTLVALYILNQKRFALSQIEQRYHLSVRVLNDDTLVPPDARLERLRQWLPGEAPPVERPAAALVAPEIDEDDDEDAIPDHSDDELGEASVSLRADDNEGNGERRGRRRRGWRRGGRNESGANQNGLGQRFDVVSEDGADPARTNGSMIEPIIIPIASGGGEPLIPGESEERARRRRRGRRGGRRRRGGDGFRGNDLSGDTNGSPRGSEVEPAGLAGTVVLGASFDGDEPGHNSSEDFGDNDDRAHDDHSEANFSVGEKYDTASEASQSSDDAGIERSNGDNEQAEVVPVRKRRAPRRKPEAATRAIAIEPLASGFSETSIAEVALQVNAGQFNVPAGFASPSAAESEPKPQAFEKGFLPLPLVNEESVFAPPPLNRSNIEIDVKIVEETKENPRRGWWGRLVK